MRRAKNTSERGFDRYDRRRLTHALQEATEIRTYRRIQAVLFVAQDRTVLEAAQITGTQPWSVYNWVRAYLHTHRLDRLQDASRSGRPQVAQTITDARLVREFRRDPMRLGYRATGWTVSLPADHLQQRYGCAISPRTLRRRYPGFASRIASGTGSDPGIGFVAGFASGGGEGTYRVPVSRSIANSWAIRRWDQPPACASRSHPPSPLE